MSQLAQISRGSGLPGRDHGGEPLHPGYAAEKGGSTLYAEASSPAFLLESLQHSPHVPPALGSNVTIDERRWYENKLYQSISGDYTYLYIFLN